MRTGFVVIIPIYQEKLNKYEKLSICNTIDKFNMIADILFICGKSFDVQKFYKENNIDNKYAINYIYYEDKYFESIENYNSLLLDPEFYRNFVDDYKYMLIVQTDAYIFDQSKIFDYFDKYKFIGAPVTIQNYLDCLKGFKRGIYYNGGLSLRNIQFCIDCLNDQKFLNWYIENNTCKDEDVIFSAYEQSFYESPNYIESLNFSIDNQFYLYAPVIDFKKPFGVHHFFNDDDNGQNKLELLKIFKWIDIEEENTDTSEVKVGAK